MRIIPASILSAIADKLPFVDDVKTKELRMPIVQLIGVDMACDPIFVGQDMSDLVFVKNEHIKQWCLKL